MRMFLLGLVVLGALGCAKAEPVPNQDELEEQGGSGGTGGVMGGAGNEMGGGAVVGGEGGSDAGAGGSDAGAGGSDAGAGGSDAGAGGSDAGAGGGAGEQAGAGGAPPKVCLNTPILNELMTAKEQGGILDEKYEFIELLATGEDANCEISLLGNKVLLGTSVIWSGGASSGFKKGKRFVLGGASYAQDGQPFDIGLSDSFLPSAGGCVELRKSDALVDRVCYGSSAGEAPAPNPGQSVGRSPDGVDTDIDSKDFKLFDKPTPGAKNL